MGTQPNRQTSTGNAPPDLAALWKALGRSIPLHLPLSGAVRQWIHAALVDAKGQLGLFNFTINGAGDPYLERRITEDVASYGRQLGWLIDALDVLIAHGPPAELREDEAAALTQVRTLRTEVEKAKAEAARDRINAILADIRRLQEEPERNRGELQLLRDALG
jgi:hypothetical protein